MSGLGDRIKSAGESFSNSTTEAIPGWLMTSGIVGWLVIGIAGMLAIASWFFVTSASISIPLLLAMVIGMIAYPLCERMTARGIHKSVAALIVLLGLIGIIIAVVWITIAGVAAQWPEIKAQMVQGVEQVEAELESAGVDTGAVTSAVEDVSAESGDGTAASNPLVSGLLSSFGSAVTSGLSSTLSLLFGVFIAATLLFYVLSDYPTVSGWLAGHMGLPYEIGEGILEDAVNAMRGYFRGTTITGLVVGVLIGLAMVILDVPLAWVVALVTFFTCYIPYFGAIISGAFAFVIALGSNGLTTAMILLVVILVTQNVLQTVINARVMGESLNLHPLVILVVTMLGGIFGGLLGAALGAPIAALLINAGKRLSAAFEPKAAEPVLTT